MEHKELALPVSSPANETPTQAVELSSRARMAMVPLSICATLSGVMTWFNLGFVEGFFWHWLGSFVSALPVMLLGLVLMSGYDKLLRRVMPQASHIWRTLVLALLMALTLELLMSSVVTLRNVGWGPAYVSVWASTFVRSLPVGLAIGLLMGFVIKPRLQRLANAISAT